MSLLSDGQVIRGTYEVERILGEGAFGEVYRVKHRFLGRQAMKVFKAAGMTMEEVEETLGEATLLSRLGHPNIIRVFDANVVETAAGPRGFFTMEYVAGGSLEGYWKSHGGRFVPVEEAVEIVRQVCRGVAVAHEEKPPIIHRDLKPHNILVGYDAAGIRVRVSDFGLAKRVNPLAQLATSAGTRVFKPPEVFRNCRSDSRAGDVWAIGTILYLLLTDRLPFQEPSSWGFLDESEYSRPPAPPSRLNFRVDRGLDRVVARALAPDPERRYQSAREMLEALEGWRPKRGDDLEDYASGPSEVSKTALGPQATVDTAEAREMVAAAFELARQPGRLADAADLMEEALNLNPDFRQRYQGIVRLWRCGIMTPPGREGKK